MEYQKPFNVTGKKKPLIKGWRRSLSIIGRKRPHRLIENKRLCQSNAALILWGDGFLWTLGIGGDFFYVWLVKMMTMGIVVMLVILRMLLLMIYMLWELMFYTYVEKTCVYLSICLSFCLFIFCLSICLSISEWKNLLIFCICMCFCVVRCVCVWVYSYVLCLPFALA